MDENQRQDWWPDPDKGPENHTSSGADTQELLTRSDTDPVSDQTLDQTDSYDNQTAGTDQSQDNNPGQNQNNPYNSWDNYAGQNQGNPYNNRNNNQGQYQGNPYNNWNNNQGQYQNNPYNNPYNQPNRPPFGFNNGMAIASLVMGILSVALICCGFSYFFGALGILFAILSRKNGPMDPQAKAGLGLSIGGTIIGLFMLIFLLVGNFSEYSDMINEYERFYNDYDDSYDDRYDNFFDNYDDYDGEDFFFDGPFQRLPNQEDFPDSGSSL